MQQNKRKSVSKLYKYHVAIAQSRLCHKKEKNGMNCNAQKVWLTDFDTYTTYVFLNVQGVALKCDKRMSWKWHFIEKHFEQTHLALRAHNQAGCGYI